MDTNANATALSADEQERIVGVAIVVEGELFSALAPFRHNKVMHMAAVAGYPTPIRGDQGFITNTGRFVNRIEAIPIAQAAGQIIEPKWPPLLYSEDLW